jgi:hypothetical protein
MTQGFDLADPNDKPGKYLSDWSTTDSQAKTPITNDTYDATGAFVQNNRFSQNGRPRPTDGAEVRLHRFLSSAGTHTNSFDRFAAAQGWSGRVGPVTLRCAAGQRSLAVEEVR